MSIAEAMLAELDQESATTRRLLERVPADQFAWKPHEKSTSLGDLAWHVATVPQFISGMAAKGSHDFARDRYQVQKATTTAGVLEAFERALVVTRETLSGLDDGQLMQPFQAMVDGKVVMTMPRVAWLRAVMLNHLYHHRGQLSVYLRLLDVPLPSIYGPSADHNPFA